MINKQFFLEERNRGLLGSFVLKSVAINRERIRLQISENAGLPSASYRCLVHIQ